jgi:hypothetical protein
MAENQIATIETREVGRPSKYESHVEPRLKEIYQWVKDGMTDYSIADQLGICHETLIKYKDNYLELSSLYTRARLERNKLVMNKMFQKATGEKVTLLKQKATKDGEIVDLVEEQYIPPDVNAADLFLRNNDPEYKSAKMSNDIGNLTINNFSLDDWQAKRQEILAEIKKLETIATSDYKVIDADSD